MSLTLPVLACFQVLLRAAVSCLASLKYDSLPLAALQLAPCAIAGLLAAVQVRVPGAQGCYAAAVHVVPWSGPRSATQRRVPSVADQTD